MTQKLICGLALAAFAGAALAQASIIGRVTNVQGLVTVSDATTVNTVVQGTPVVTGTRFVTSSTGTATLNMYRDCDITLKPNQTLTVEENRSCAALLALVQTLPGTVVAASSPNLAQVLGLLGAAAILAASSGGSGGAAAPGGGAGGGGGGQLPNLSGQ